MQFARRSASPFETSCSPSPQGVEVGNAVDAEHHGLTIDDELLEPVLQRGLDDPREAAGPVGAAHAIAIALNDQAIAIVGSIAGGCQLAARRASGC